MLISKFNTENMEERVREFEAKYSFVFPEQYRSFLLKYNGGKTPNTEFRINKVSADVEGFYGLGNATQYHNYSSFESMDGLEDWLKDSVLPIAENSFGDYIMIGIGNTNNGKVYFYYHDRQKKYIELSENFKMFISKCKSEKIGRIRSIEERYASMISKGRKEFIDKDLIKIWQDEIDEYAGIHQEELVI